MLNLNQSLIEGLFPHNCTGAGVSSVCKTGYYTDCGNYRPMSALSVVTRRFEKTIIKLLAIVTITTSDVNLSQDLEKDFRMLHLY